MPRRTDLQSHAAAGQVPATPTASPARDAKPLIVASAVLFCVVAVWAVVVRPIDVLAGGAAATADGSGGGLIYVSALVAAVALVLGLVAVCGNAIVGHRGGGASNLGAGSTESATRGRDENLSLDLNDARRDPPRPSATLSEPGAGPSASERPR